MMIDTIPKLKLMVAFAKCSKAKFGQDLSTHLNLNIGKTYTALYDLYDDGFLNCSPEPINKHRFNLEPRQYYKPTRKGRNEIKAQLKKLNLLPSSDGVMNVGLQPFGTRSSLALVQVFATLAQSDGFIPVTQLVAKTGLTNNTVYPMANRAIDLGQVDWRYSETLNKQNKPITEYRLNAAGRQATQIELSKLGLELAA